MVIFISASGIRQDQTTALMQESGSTQDQMVVLIQASDLRETQMVVLNKHLAQDKIKWLCQVSIWLKWLC
jgi:hypothetical protein